MSVAPFDFLSFLIQISPIIQLVVVIGSILVSAVVLGRKIGKFETKFDDINASTLNLNKATTRLNNCVVEIQSLLRNKLSLVIVQETLAPYGISNSPIVLREEFHKFITKTGLDGEIEKNKTELVKWLKSKNPQTGLDAQEYLFELVISKEIETMIDTTKFKEYLYEKGKSNQDYAGILSIYLFEKIIPEVIEERKSKDF